MTQRILSLTGRLLLLLIAAVNHQAVGQSGATQHFRWSERLAHELSYQHTISNARELTTTERAALLTFVLNRFKHPINRHDAEMFKGIPDEQMRKLAADTRIDLVDLNGDGTDEIIAQGNGLGPCGGTGNCLVLVLRRTLARFQLLLDSRAGNFGGGFEKIRVLEMVTNGFRDLALASHISASDRTIEVFRFDGGQYRRSGCYYSRMREDLKEPEISRGCAEEN